MSGMPNFQCVGPLQLFEFAYTLFLLGDRSGSYFVLSAGVCTVRESFCWLTGRVRTFSFCSSIYSSGVNR